MGCVEKLTANAQPFLEPGEQVQAAFFGQTKSGLRAGMLLGAIGALLFRATYRDVIATDRRILVLDAGKTPVKPQSVLRVLPRSTQIGPPHGLWYKTEALGEPLWFAKAVQKHIAKADAGAGQSQPLSP